MTCGAVILAAGSASRMGRLKQLLPFGPGTLLTHTVEQAITAGFGPVVVVRGSESESVGQAVQGRPILLADNVDWSTGMGSSLHCGLNRLLAAEPTIAAIALLLGDQPLVTAEHLRAMHEALSNNDADAVAAAYNETLGAPAIFRARTFPALQALPSDVGARKLLRASGLNVIPFALPEAATDVDTPDDYSRLQHP